MRYYIADLHFNHRNINKYYDKRGSCWPRKGKIFSGICTTQGNCVWRTMTRVCAFASELPFVLPPQSIREDSLLHD